MTDQQKQLFWKELGQVFIWSWWDFDQAFDRLMKVLERYGFERK